MSYGTEIKWTYNITLLLDTNIAWSRFNCQTPVGIEQFAWLDNWKFKILEFNQTMHIDD